MKPALLILRYNPSPKHITSPSNHRGLTAFPVGLICGQPVRLVPHNRNAAALPTTGYAEPQLAVKAVRPQRTASGGVLVFGTLSDFLNPFNLIAAPLIAISSLDDIGLIILVESNLFPPSCESLSQKPHSVRRQTVKAFVSRARRCSSRKVAIICSTSTTRIK